MESPPQRCDITTVTLSTPLKEIMKNYGTLPNFRGKAKRMSNKTEMITVI